MTGCFFCVYGGKWNIGYFFLTFMFLHCILKYESTEFPGPTALPPPVLKALCFLFYFSFEAGFPFLFSEIW